jgi:hypothetical protein
MWHNTLNYPRSTLAITYLMSSLDKAITHIYIHIDAVLPFRTYTQIQRKKNAKDFDRYQW